MNALLQWFTSPEWAQVVRALLHSLWQGALVAAGLALLLRRPTSPTLRYRLSLAGLGAIVVATVVTWGVLSAPQAAKPHVVPSKEPVVETPTPTAKPAEALVVTANWTLAQRQVQWTAWLAVAWLLGAGGMLVRASIKVAGAEQLRRSARPLDNPHVARLVAEARCVVKLTRQVRVAVTERFTSPAVVGVLVPTLILPLSLITTLSQEQIRFILLHELAHIRRGDYLANLFQLLAEALLFFNPAVWWISHQIRCEREVCCDALAIELSGAPADYARTLVSVAETVLNPSAAAAPAFGNNRESSSLADRIQRLLVPGYRPSLRLTWQAMLTALVLAGAVLGSLALGTRQTVAAAMATNASESLPLNPNAVDFPYVMVAMWPDFLQIGDDKLREFMPNAADPSRPWVLGAAEARQLQSLLSNAGATRFYSAEPLTGQIASGMRCRWRIGATNNRINYLVQDVVSAGSTNKRVVGVDADFLADVPGWVPMEFSMVPRTQSNGVRCQLTLRIRGETTKATVTVPPAGGLVWTTPEGTANKGVHQLIVLRDEPPPKAPGETDADTSIPSLEPSTKEGASVPVPVQATTRLLTRTFKVDPNEFARALGLAGPVQSTNGFTAVRDFFAEHGLDLHSPESMFYNDRAGLLWVRAKAEELDAVQSLLEVMNTAPAQVNIRCKFVEIPEGQFAGFLSEFTSATNAESPFTTGILTEPRTKVILKALDQGQGVKILSTPSVTTRSGRRAQIQVVDLQSVVTGAVPVVTNGVATNVFKVEQMRFGPILDVTPKVSADGHSIHMVLTASVKEFLGYDNPGPFKPGYRWDVGVPNDALPLPRFRLRHLTTAAQVWDGQTIVLGGFVSETVTRQPDGSESHETTPEPDKGRLLVFVTPTIIDPAGNRVHPEAPPPNGRTQTAPQPQSGGD